MTSGSIFLPPPKKEVKGSLDFSVISKEKLINFLNLRMANLLSLFFDEEGRLRVRESEGHSRFALPLVALEYGEKTITLVEEDLGEAEDLEKAKKEEKVVLGDPKRPPELFELEYHNFPLPERT